MVELFYGHFLAVGVLEGETTCSIEDIVNAVPCSLIQRLG